MNKYSRAELEAAARARGISEDEIKRVFDNIGKLKDRGLVSVHKNGELSITAAGRKRAAENRAAGLIPPKIGST